MCLVVTSTKCLQFHFHVKFEETDCGRGFVAACTIPLSKINLAKINFGGGTDCIGRKGELI